MAEVPPAVVTVTSTMLPKGCPGLTAVIVVPFGLTTKLAAGVLPKFTFVAPARLAPVIVTIVPPS